jgi:hypothetical protein
MSDSRVAGGMDRLPWLADEPMRKAAPVKGRRLDLTAWAVAAVLVVTATAFWFGNRSAVEETTPQGSGQTATVAVPQPSAPVPEIHLAPQPQVAAPTQPEVRVIRVPEIRLVPAPAPKVSPTDEVTAAPADATSESAAAEKAATETPAAKAAPSKPLVPWQPRVVAGAAGRLVQVGAFGSVDQAKQGWRYMVRTYPAMAHLPAVVRPDRNSKGRVFYRFRVGTTSQAHSEVLCQRMEKIHLSCAVVGLPWKAKVER